MLTVEVAVRFALTSPMQPLWAMDFGVKVRAVRLIANQGLFIFSFER